MSPDAVTEKVTVWPADTVWLAGCVVMEGASGNAVTFMLTVTFTISTPSLTVTVTAVLPAAFPVIVTVPMSREVSAIDVFGPAVMAVMVRVSLSASTAISEAVKLVVLLADTVWTGIVPFAAGALI